MAKWVLVCPSCAKDIVHSDVVVRTFHVDPITTTPKPELPPEGMRLECPYCRAATLFKRQDLIYRAGKTNLAADPAAAPKVTTQESRVDASGQAGASGAKG